VITSVLSFVLTLSPISQLLEFIISNILPGHFHTHVFIILFPVSFPPFSRYPNKSGVQENSHAHTTSFIKLSSKLVEAVILSYCVPNLGRQDHEMTIIDSSLTCCHRQRL